MKALFVLASLFSLFGSAAGLAPVRTVPHVDLERYAGTWYEVARFPNRFQKKCAREVTATYQLNGGKVAVTNRCVKSDGTTTEIRGKAKVVDTSTNAKLKVTFFWPFYGDYWILGLDPEYRWAVVGAPNRKYLWLLSRAKTLSGEQRESALKAVRENGFDPSRLVDTPQITSTP